MKKYFFLWYILILSILVLPSITAQVPVFQKNTNVTYNIPCSFNQTECSSAATCNITIWNPNQTIVMRNTTIVVSSNSIFEVKLNQTHTRDAGTYEGKAYCFDQNVRVDPDLEYIVNVGGYELTIPQAIIYAVLLFICVILFGLSLWTTIKIPFKDGRDEEGNIVTVNDLKIVKIMMGWITYLILLAVVGLTQGLVGRFLFIEAAGNFFRVIYFVMVALILPSFGIMLIFMGIAFFRGKKFKRILERGGLPK